jgi:hypothetical protein
VKTAYSFSILRFIYDAVTLEFVNVGIVVYSPTTKQLQAKCTNHYSRISNLFENFDGLRFRQTVRYIQDEINEIALQIPVSLQFSPPSALSDILNSVLPIDDSSFQFASGGAGTTDDFATLVDHLFVRYVEHYGVARKVAQRNDEDVWRSFRPSLDRKNITAHLVPKRIISKDYEYEFAHSWKNGTWHVYEPVSFDLLDSNAMLDKANRWIGRAISLGDSIEPFKPYFLLGTPSDSRLESAFRKSENLLHKIPIPHEFVRESEAEEFAKELAAEIERHG